MNAEQALALQRDLGLAVGIPNDILYGQSSHAPRWHSFSILGHVWRTAQIARGLVEAGAAEPALVTLALWHDVGKLLAVQPGPTGPTFHGHAEAGADYLNSVGTFPAVVINSIRCHGELRLVGQSERAFEPDAFLLWLELCDEMGKWTEAEFPPEGSEKTRVRRAEQVRRLISYGIGEQWINLAAELSFDAGAGWPDREAILCP